MKNYTFLFYPNNKMATITVKAETKNDAEQLIRTMIAGRYFDDGLIFVEEY